MKKRIFFICLAIASLTFSCKKSTSEQSSGSCRELRSTSSMTDDFFYYDASGNISKIMFINLPSDTSWQNYYYKNGHLVYMIRLYKGTKGDTVFYTYNSGNYVEVNESGFMLKYYYDQSNLLAKIERYDSGKLTAYSDYYFDPRGNCRNCDQYERTGSGFGFKQIDFIEYGDFKNPDHSIGLPPLNDYSALTGEYLSPNNVVKWTMITSYSDSIVMYYHYKSFNNNGYPLSYKVGDSTGNQIISNETLEYLCP